MISSEIHKLCLKGGALLGSFSFFALSLFCFLLALGTEAIALNRCAPALLWILALLTFLFSTPLFLKTEFQAGLLEEIFLHPLSPACCILSKIGAEVLLLGLPLLGIGVLFSPFFSLSWEEIVHFFLAVLIGLPALSALGILGGLLTLETRGGGILIALLILPLSLPLFLLTLSIMEMTRLGLDSFSPFCLLMGISLFLTLIAVGAGHWALRFAVEG